MSIIILHSKLQNPNQKKIITKIQIKRILRKKEKNQIKRRVKENDIKITDI